MCGRKLCGIFVCSLSVMRKENAAQLYQVYQRVFYLIIHSFNMTSYIESRVLKYPQNDDNNNSTIKSQNTKNNTYTVRKHHSTYTQLMIQKDEAVAIVCT